MLDVVDLAVARGGVPLLEGVSFRLGAGEAVVLRGPNGAGKTSLLRCLAGLLPPLAGRIGVDPDAVAYAAHLDGVKPALTVEENLHFWARVHGAADLRGALGAMDLAPLRHRLAAELSAGQKRRLGLARLVVTGRPLWLLDEPTVSLDAASSALFEAMLGGHLAAGGAAVISTHLPLAGRTLDLAAHRAALPEVGW